jgi:Spy/CpxP family protein refolding chaperone
MKSKIQFILAILTLAFLTAAPLAMAQDAGNPPPPGRNGRRGGGMNIEMLKTALKLTDDQVAKITPILAKQREQMQALMSDDSMSREDRMAKMQEYGKATHDAIRAILTPDQQKTFDAMPPPGRGPRGNRNGGGGGGNPPPPPPPPGA